MDFFDRKIEKINKKLEKLEKKKEVLQERKSFLILEKESRQERIKKGRGY